MSLCEEIGNDARLVHPFDHPYIWEGHASIVDELADSLPKKPDAIVSVVGGGGLLAGLLLGLEKNGWGDVPVVACETQGASKLAQSMEKGDLGL